MNEALISISLGSLMGLVLGLTGAGGAVLAVPMLMWGLNWTLPQAAPVALLAVAASAAIGTLAAWDVAVIRYRAAVLMSLIGMIFSPLGLIAADWLPANVLTALFAAVLIMVSLRMFRATLPHAKAAADAGLAQRVCQVRSDDRRIAWNRRCFAAIAATGSLTGLLSGLLGVGGGFVIVPALRAVTSLTMHAAIATSLMTVSLTSAGTVVAAVLQGKPLPVLIALPFVAGAIAGMLLGRKLSSRLAGHGLQRGFALLLGAISIAMLVQAGMALYSHHITA